jgi:hypothetical protein
MARNLNGVRKGECGGFLPSTTVNDEEENGNKEE